MRIIGAKYRGLRLRTLNSEKLRPTTDHMRETLFDVLGPRIEGATFLDAYAGTGAVGIEAISRGASDVVFIEHHRPAAQLIRATLKGLGIESGYVLLTSEVPNGLERLERESERFDIVFLDPPYAEIREYHHTLRQLALGPLLGPESIVIAEHSKHIELEKNYLTLKQTRLLRHGDTQLGFYRLSAENSMK